MNWNTWLVFPGDFTCFVRKSIEQTHAHANARCIRLCIHEERIISEWEENLLRLVNAGILWSWGSARLCKSITLLIFHCGVLYTQHRPIYVFTADEEMKFNKAPAFETSLKDRPEQFPQCVVRYHLCIEITFDLCNLSASEYFIWRGNYVGGQSSDSFNDLAAWGEVEQCAMRN